MTDDEKKKIASEFDNLDAEKIYDTVRLSAVNKKELEDDSPLVRYECDGFPDMYFTFYLPHEKAAAFLTYGALSNLKLDTMKLLKKAHWNTLMAGQWANVANVLEKEESDVSKGLTVITVEGMFLGAGIIGCVGFDAMVHDVLHTDSFFLFPSSRHEVLVLPAENIELNDENKAKLIFMQKGVPLILGNKGGFLSDKVYLYKDGKYEIIGG